ncbi:sigma-70 family RNA polymerase sigma factor [Microbacterium sp. MPKO10]|uniref:sigma-70 family RNA polymerase sigma factor n=1 Tax=Microbacterium sp. MPKO10 TaxID=2989818 RepID=UPI002236BC63|nr:sigma-70 family RNA polymerase sigma factor [Microbacterium sp. MPKO10]MCW4458020.1 sigma-70 family RNA polymerase sigma factor [Microbacterium sp. MPKO10]
MEEKSLSAAFEMHRPRLLSVATRALGSRADAEDAVQEAWLRLDRQENDGIDNLGGWLTRVVGRICIDMLRSRTARAESALGTWESDPIVAEDVEDPENAAVTADSLGLALVVVLESLRPEERLAFILHDMFAVPFAEVGTIVGRSTDAAKMLASRARRKVQEVPRPTGERQQRREVVEAFLAAAREGDFDALLSVLDPDVTWHRHTAHGHSVKIGANEVLAAVRRGDPGRVEVRRVSVNGEPGVLAWGPSGKPIALMSCTVADGRLVDIVSILDPSWLARLSLPPRVAPTRP